MRVQEESRPILRLTFHELKADDRLLDKSPLLASQHATVQDEEILSLSTRDGGEAWLWGPGSATNLSVACEVDALTPELVSILFDYAHDGPSTIAVWHDLDAGDPRAVIVVSGRDAFDRPRSWPEPKRCAGAGALLTELRVLAATA